MVEKVQRVEKEVSFTDKDISDFCSTTQDDNVLHNSDFMKEHGKLPIVPGMLIFTYAANLAEDFLRNSANFIEIYYGLPLSSDEPVIISSTPEKPLEVRLSVQKNGEDLLSSGDNYSRLLKAEQTYKPKSLSRTFPLDLDPSDIDKFADLINAKEDNVGFLFAFAYSSHALLESIRNPSTQVEIHLNQMINNDGILPVYRSSTIYLPDGIQGIDSRTIYYRTHMEQTGKRNFVFYVECVQNGNLLYNAISSIIPISEKIMMRKIAKNIPAE